jgi:hypothetical protein
MFTSCYKVLRLGLHGTFPILTIAGCKGVKLLWDGLLVDHEIPNYQIHYVRKLVDFVVIHNIACVAC